MIPLANLNIILVNTRFPENIGMSARACANMGCGELCLVRPERWNLLKSQPLATPKGQDILKDIKIYPSLANALTERHLAIATTARTGGWRKAILSPAQAAGVIIPSLAAGEKVSLVFGPENQGLDNEEIILCQEIAHIWTPGPASSLNLAQAVLIMLYECVKIQDGKIDIEPLSKDGKITLAEYARLENEFQETLELIDCLHGKNPDYFFIQWKRILYKASLRRHEYDALMGFCRQIKNKLGRKAENGKNARE